MVLKVSKAAKPSKRKVLVEIGAWDDGVPDWKVTFHGLWAQQDINFAFQVIQTEFDQRQVEQFRLLDAGKEVN